MELWPETAAQILESLDLSGESDVKLEPTAHKASLYVKYLTIARFISQLHLLE